MSKDLTATAYHEAGHVVASWWHRLAIRKASVIVDEHTLGRVTSVPPGKRFQPDAELDVRTHRRIEQEITSFWAGPLAEEKFTGKRNETGASGDLEAIFDLASYVCGSEEETEAYIEWLRLRTSNLIERPPLWARVERVAAALVRDKELSGRELRDLLVDELPHRSDRA